MGSSFTTGSGPSRGKFVCHPYLQRRNAAKMQRWIDTFFEEGGLSELVEAASIEDDGDTPELEVTFLSSRGVWR